MVFVCKKCAGVSFKYREHLNRHVRLKHSATPISIQCPECPATFTRNSDLTRHINSVHREGSHQCQTCNNKFRTQLDLDAHVSQDHTTFKLRPYNTRPPTSTRINYKLRNNNFIGAMKVYRMTSDGFNDIFSYKREVGRIVKYLVMTTIDEQKAVKWHLRLHCEFVKATDASERFSTHFTSPVQIGMLKSARLVRESINVVFGFLTNAIDVFEERGSGWELDVCGDVCDLYSARYRPIRAASYIQLPRWLAGRRSVINIKNKDTEDCFTLSVLAALFPQEEHVDRPAKYLQYQKHLDCSMLVYPVSVEAIDDFEKVNGLTINVFGVDDQTVVPLRLSKAEGYEVCLLYIENEEKQHYCLIKDLDQFMKTSDNAAFVCRKCLLVFSSEDVRSRHVKNCVSDHQTQELPTEKNNIVKFNQIRNMHRVPLTFVADLETMIVPIMGCQPDPSTTFTYKKDEHLELLAAARGVQQCCGLDTRNYINLDVEEGAGATERMIRRIMEAGKEFQRHITEDSIKTRDAILTKDQEDEHRRKKQCEICEEEFREYLDEEDDKLKTKCLDHCHLCGKYRMALCAECNEQYQLTRNVHVYMHNFSGFDATFVAPAVAKIANEENYKLECLAKEGDNFITISMRIPFGEEQEDVKKNTFWRLKFFDSLSFLPGSLSTLTDALRKEGDDRFHAMLDEFGAATTPMLLRKGVMPYKYFDDEKRLDEKMLPPIYAFYNDLKDEALDQDSYDYAWKVWNEMGCTTLRDYYIVYLKCDVNQLVDVWENYRVFTLQHYKLDAARYVTGPSLSYNAMLLMTKVELELVRDIEMWEMICNGIRGGLSVISNRLEYANDGADQESPLNTLFFVDAVNLYGYAMMQSLGKGCYRWLEKSEIELFDVQMYNFDSDKGFLIECDLEYPKELHDAHDSNPLAPELMSVNCEMLSDFQKCRKNNNVDVPKLIAHLGYRKNYVLDYRNLQLYLNLGMKLSCIHRILEFDQCCWMKPYILFNTNMRRNATSDFQKLLFKLMNNSCYGKQLEDPMKYRETVMCTNATDVEKLVKKPNYVGSIVYSDYLVCVNMRPLKVKLNKMRIVGCQITEIAKHRMQDYYYNCLYRTFGSNLSLCIHDTDSYLVCIKNESNVFDKLYNVKDWHDFSTLSSDHICYDVSHKGVPGFMAPECNGKPIEAVVGIRAKCYAILFKDCTEKKRIKGISKSVRDNVLKFYNYENCLLNDVNRRDNVTTLRRYCGKMYTEVVNKASLVNYDDKRYLCNSLFSYAHGNYNIVQHMDCD